MLLGVRGVGPELASVLWSEGLSRQFDNRRQVAAYAGLAPTPWKSGSVNRDQGISQSGNPRLRTTMIQLAWLWLRHQPGSALTLWFQMLCWWAGGKMSGPSFLHWSPSHVCQHDVPPDRSSRP